MILDRNMNKRRASIEALTHKVYNDENDLLEHKVNLWNEDWDSLEAGYLQYLTVMGGFIPPQEYLRYLGVNGIRPTDESAGQLKDKYKIMVSGDMIAFQVFHGEQVISQVGQKDTTYKILELDEIVVVDNTGLVHYWNLHPGDVYLANWIGE